MIAYAMTITKGCIHSPYIELQIGNECIRMLCAPLRAFVRAANDFGLYQILETVDPKEHDILTFLYEEFKDKI